MARIAKSLITYVYFFGCPGFVKIGWATDPYTRFKGNQVGNPHDLEWLGLMLGGDSEERTLHAHFRELRHRGEWYRREPPLTDLLAEIHGKDAVEAREAAGEWYLSRTRKLTLLLSPHVREIAYRGVIHAMPTA